MVKTPLLGQNDQNCHFSQFWEKCWLHRLKSPKLAKMAEMTRMCQKRSKPQKWSKPAICPTYPHGFWSRPSRLAASLGTCRPCRQNPRNAPSCGPFSGFHGRFKGVSEPFYQSVSLGNSLALAQPMRFLKGFLAELARFINMCRSGTASLLPNLRFPLE